MLPITIDGILAALPHLAPDERALIERAFHRADLAHKGQLRKSGEPYITHCVAVAQILADMGLDATTIAAALLHDTIEDTTITREDLEAEFGPKIAELVDGVTKLKQLADDVKPAGHNGHSHDRHDRNMEYLRKMFLAMGADLRVLLIKLADRLHNMRTLEHMPPHKRRRIAKETLEIYAPLANRLGIWQFKWQLEDLAFRYLQPQKYHALAAQLNERRSDREADLRRLQAFIADHFAREGLKAEITARPKHIYSIYRKMERKNLPIDQIYDVRAIRIIVDSVSQCYQALGIIHNIFHAIPGEFDDYISSPKENSYRSLHTAVIDDQGKTLEVQIRTREMHEEAEYGVAAHWRYKENRSARGNEAFDRRLELLRRTLEEILETGTEQDATGFVQGMMDQLGPDRIYAFTPKGDIIDLPEGATPIDFAYYVHTEVGHRCRGAKVNGRLVSLNYKLRNGDRVEIQTAKQGGPSLDWLNPDLSYVKTARARNKIKQWFRKRERENAIAAGKDVLDRELRKLGKSTVPRDEIAAQLGFGKAEELLLAIGRGEVTGAQISRRLLELEHAPESDDQLKPTGPSQEKPVSAEGMIIDGADDLLNTLARCCNPTYGDEIVGFITRGRGITIHRATCKNILNTNEPERIIQVSWPPQPAQQAFPVPIRIIAYDREGLMRDIGSLFADENINVTDVSVKARNGIATFELTIVISDVTELARVLARVESLPNVLEALRKTS